jgi:hypothetical protein
LLQYLEGQYQFTMIKKRLAVKNSPELRCAYAPTRGNIIETSFKQELLHILQQNNPDFKDWMLTINYEIEKKANGNCRKGEKNTESIL